MYSWLFRDLYIWPNGKLGRSTYVIGLVRVFIIYMIFSPLLSAIISTQMALPHGGQFEDNFQDSKWGQVAAIVLLAFPIWSLLQRRTSDMRPDIRQKLSPWSVGLPLIVVLLIIVMIIEASGFLQPLGVSVVGELSLWLAVGVITATFVPGGDQVPEKTTVKKVQRQDAFIAQAQAAANKAVSNMAASKIEVSGKPTYSGQAHRVQVEQRQYKLPEQGRVKSRWFG